METSGDRERTWQHGPGWQTGFAVDNAHVSDTVSRLTTSFLGDISVSPARCDESQHLHFSSGQTISCAAVLTDNDST